MMKKKNILILTGSPRKRGNSDQMAEALKKGAELAGHQVTIFRSADHQIDGCVACEGCWSKGKPCVFTDDFDHLYPFLEEADVIVYATPLYWFSFPVQLKSAIDKMYAYAGKRSPQPLKISECVLMVVGGDDDPVIFDGIIGSYRAIAHYMNWQDRGILAYPGVHAIDDIHQTDALIRAHQLGEAL
jgi:multimeric flavodoxin WrbA